MITQVDLPYQADSTRIYERLRQLPWPVMLDSGPPGPARGRYDILCADPLAWLTHEGDSTRVVAAGTEHCYRHRDRDPFALLQALMDQHGPATSAETPCTPGIPFAGGLLGYFGYDLGRSLEQLPSLAAADLNLPTLRVGLYPWALVTDHKEGKSRLLSQLLPREALDRLARRLAPSATTRQGGDFKLGSRFTSNLSRADYKVCFDRIQAYIAAGDCYQVNLAQRFSASCTGDSWQAYLRLRQVAPTPFSAFIEWPGGALLSLSPERFLKVAAGQVETCPIKGTRPRAADADADRAQADALEQSAKDRAENLMIVDLLRNDLGRTCLTGSVRVPELFQLRSYANVHHLVSRITGKLASPQDVLPLLRGCFPGGSITGAPKVRAMEIIEELEPHRRGPYCGAIGYIGFNGRMDTNIAIRTLVRDADLIHCWAGGGIVADSRREAEYCETFDKVANLLATLEADLG